MHLVNLSADTRDSLIMLALKEVLRPWGRAGQERGLAPVLEELITF